MKPLLLWIAVAMLAGPGRAQAQTRGRAGALPASAPSNGRDWGVALQRFARTDAGQAAFAVHLPGVELGKLAERTARQAQTELAPLAQSLEDLGHTPQSFAFLDPDARASELRIASDRLEARARKEARRQAEASARRREAARRAEEAMRDHLAGFAPFRHPWDTVPLSEEIRRSSGW